MFDILHRVGIGATQDKVFEQLTSTEGIKAWWDSTGVTGSAKAGDVFNLTWASFEVMETRPGELVKWKVVKGPEDWLNTEITFKLEWRKDQTFVLFSHAKYKKSDEFMAHCSTKWAGFLLSLKSLVEKGEGHPAPNDVKVFVGERG